ncbi:MAG TPA: hypothetical protein VFX21_04120, partial [Acidimicrobiia bacterium]|nr:hypothetical protein [Acidimicrobiia bacterium]
MRSLRRAFVLLIAIIGVVAVTGCAGAPPILPSSSPAPSVMAAQDEGAEQALINSINSLRAS